MLGPLLGVTLGLFPSCRRAEGPTEPGERSTKNSEVASTAFWGGQKAQRQGSVTLAAVGDVLLDRGVSAQMRRRGDAHPFKEVRAVLRAYDLVFFNLECPLSRRGVARRTDVAFRGRPEHAKLLRWAGFSVASLANNHTLDYGREALMDTVAAVEGAGITAVGAGKDMARATRVRVVEVRGLRVGFLAYTDVPNAGTTILPQEPSVAGADLVDLRKKVAQVAPKVDVLVVSFHWGVEYMKQPTRRQEKLAQTAIDAGAHLILGHHPHVLQPLGSYRGRPIVYSAGGFVWDSRIRDSHESAIFTFRLARGRVTPLETIPVRIRLAQPRVVPKTP